jgi:acetyl-CoA carboxylase carboxyltransferase component
MGGRPDRGNERKRRGRSTTRRELETSDDPVLLQAQLAAEYARSEAEAIPAASKGFVDDVIHASDTLRYLTDFLALHASKPRPLAPRKHDNIPL